MQQDDNSSKEIRLSWLVPCRDEHGHRVNVGVAVTRGGLIALIGPPQGTAVLAPDGTAAYRAKILGAIIAAAQPRPSDR